MKGIFTLTIVTICLASAGSAIAVTRLSHGDPFTGKWNVKVTPDEDARRAGGKEFDDVLVFNANQFLSTELKKRGFGSCDYDEDTRRDGPAQFSAKPTSDTDGSVVWQGNINANEMNGTLVWKRKDGTVLNYNFTGSKAD